MLCMAARPRLMNSSERQAELLAARDTGAVDPTPKAPSRKRLRMDLTATSATRLSGRTSVAAVINPGELIGRSKGDLHARFGEVPVATLCAMTARTTSGDAPKAAISAAPFLPCEVGSC